MKLQQHLNQYINIYIHTECCKISFICSFIVTAKNFTSGFFIFLFMVTGRGIIAVPTRKSVFKYVHVCKCWSRGLVVKVLAVEPHPSKNGP